MSKNLVFTSCGDNTSFDLLWTHPDKMNFDIYIIYYGDCDETFERYCANEKINIITRRKGSKFQNFKYFYDTLRDIIDKYSYFFILDDDIIFNFDDINKMFLITRQYNLSICGPSFQPESKISHNITKNKNGIELTYTNFVEVNVPLFNYEALVNFMNVYDGTLIGWGIDYLYIYACGISKTDSYAIIHSVSCVNPHNKLKKNKTRELSLIDGFQKRSNMWDEFAKSRGYKSSYKHIEYKSIMKTNNQTHITNYI
uniref:Glycosyltransferase 2-like domain-containing protein n=1 Tax=viral metagenome TaxID=1070528 RepID=A0A6C0E6I2_9ZZZZ